MRTSLIVVGATGLAALAANTFTSVQASSGHLAATQRYIEQGITSKGKVLTENHARALRGLALDNAFLDMQRLVAGVVAEDTDLVYGLYVNAEGAALAFGLHGAPATVDQSVAKDAWKALGVPREALLVKREWVGRAQRLGEDVLEVAVPVLGDAGEALGTIRYGFSTRPMHDAIARARQDARRRLVRSVLGLGAVVGVAALLAMLLSTIQATRITRSVGALTKASEARAHGARAVRVEIVSDDEIGLLGASFNRMGDDLDASYLELEGLNQRLEDKVAERTVELARRNGDLKLVMDNVGQGFVTLAADGTMSAERSRVVDEWFGAPEGRPTFWAYLARTDARVAEWFELGWTALWDDILPVALCLDQLPAMIHSGGKTFELAYRPVREGERLGNVIVVITDVSARIERERAEQAQREMMSIFRHTLSDRAALDAFFIETSALVDAVVRATTSEALVVRRQVHTIKGNAALFGLETVSAHCELLEERLAESPEPLSEAERESLRVAWAKIDNTRAQLTDLAPAASVEIDPDEYHAFLGDLRRQLAYELLEATAASWQFEPASKRLALFGDQVRGLARRLGRANVELTFVPTTLRLPPRWSLFWSAFAHVVRNTVDHGVQTTDQRLATGKPAHATVSLGIAREGEGVVVSISDDGPGIEWSRIAASARLRGLPAGSPRELEEALFHDGVSSRSAVTETSGRGVGLSAVRQVVHDLGGKIELASEPGRGTTFRFVLPLTMLVEDAAGELGGSAGFSLENNAA